MNMAQFPFEQLAQTINYHLCVAPSTLYVCVSSNGMAYMCV